MRYSDTETTTLGGFFEPNKTVTIKVLDSEGVAIDLTDNSCSPSEDENTMYLWSTSNMNTDAGTYFYIMTDGIHKMPGKFTYGGSINKLETLAADVWAADDRTVTGLNADAEQSGMTQDEHDKLFSLVNYANLHKDLDNYPNKAYYNTDFTDTITDTKDELLVKINDLSVATGKVDDRIRRNNSASANALAHQTAAIDLLRKFNTNRVFITPDASRITLYDDDGETIIYEFEMKAQNKQRTPVKQYGT